MENQETQPQLLKDYSDLEKGAYLGAMASIASADHNASEEELKFLQALCQAAELPAVSTEAVLGAAKDPKHLSMQKMLDVLKGSDLRYTFISDIMSFAKADGEVSAAEETNIKQMADYLGVNQQQYGALKQFVEVADQSAEKGEVPVQALGNEGGGGGIGDMLKNAGIPTNGLMKGVLAVAAPLLIAKILGGRRGGMRGGMGSMGGMGGMGGGLLGGLLGTVLAGGMGGGGMMGGGRRSGGLGSILGGMGGMMGGRNRGGITGGLGSILGSVLGGGRRTSGW